MSPFLYEGTRIYATPFAVTQMVLIIIPTQVVLHVCYLLCLFGHDAYIAIGCNSGSDYANYDNGNGGGFTQWRSEVLQIMVVFETFE